MTRDCGCPDNDARTCYDLRHWGYAPVSRGSTTHPEFSVSTDDQCCGCLCHEEPGDAYTCAACGETFAKDDTSDEEMMEEATAAFGPVNQGDCDVVCDDCYKQMTATYDPSLWQLREVVWPAPSFIAHGQ